jgi:hypothetical protein
VKRDGEAKPKPPFPNAASARAVLAEALPEGWNRLLRQIQEREAAPLFAHDNQVSEQRAARHKRG